MWLVLALAAPVTWLVFLADGWSVNRLVVAIWSTAGRLGIRATPEQTDGLLNTAMLLPSALLAALWLPRVRWWVWAVAGATASVMIEAVQYWMARDASAHDVAFNSLGATIGALAGAGINRWVAGRSDLVQGTVGVLGEEPGRHHRHAEHHPEQHEQGRASCGGDDPRHQ